ncbi:uncharacterized protein LOC143591939 [Bidens hawaiensis]|uniref:uncharacterized protein LOC143591939 n=1 Tax=Bidens hawaiensis TaxID=980011 RepID=UPI00404A1813
MPESLESNAENQDQEKEHPNFQSVQTDGPLKPQVISTRSCTKVHKQGYALGRSVNLTKFNNYNELISELDELFEFNGELKNGNRNWLVAYTDDEGSLMLVGDDPWEEFCGMVRKMFIYTREEVQRMNPGTSNSRHNALEGLQPQQYLDFDSDLWSEQLKMSKLVNNLVSVQDQEKEYQSLQAVQPDGRVKAQSVSAGAVILESHESNAGRKVTYKKRRNLNVEWPVIAASAGAVILAGVASLWRG